MGDDEEPKGSAKTIRGFAAPDPGNPQDGMFDDATLADEGSSPQQGPDESGELYLPPGTQPLRSVHDNTPLVEIEVVHQHGSAPRVEAPAQTLEVWTQNRVYTMDPSGICVRVADRHSGAQDAKHPFLGFKLVGGQHRDGESFEISYPFPRPGTEAVFEHPRSGLGNFSRTSTVTRVVLRLHVVTVRPNVLVPTWSGITNPRLQLPPEPSDNA
ncbi:MAG: hypothetical protein AAGE52_08585 [Myxococcota bacterium]